MKIQSRRAKQHQKLFFELKWICILNISLVLNSIYPSFVVLFLKDCESFNSMIGFLIIVCFVRAFPSRDYFGLRYLTWLFDKLLLSAFFLTLFSFVSFFFFNVLRNVILVKRKKINISRSLTRKAVSFGVISTTLRSLCFTVFVIFSLLF